MFSCIGMKRRKMEEIIWSCAFFTTLILGWAISRWIRQSNKEIKKLIIDVGIALGLSKEKAQSLLKESEED